MLHTDLICYIESLTLGQGRYAGTRFRLLSWQKRFLRGAFGQDDDAALSLARGGGKTTFTAAIAAAAVNGPLVEPMAECVLVASSFEQAVIGFRHALHFLRPAIEAEPKRYRVQDSANRASIQDRQSGAMLRCIGSDPKRMHGLAPKLLLLDELAQWESGKIDSALSALRTSRGKIQGSKALWIGTRPASPDHPFEKALQDQGVGYSQVHAARPQDPTFQRRTWKRSNPGLDHLPDLEAVIRREAKAAKSDPAELASFQALRLNMGIADTLENTLLDAHTWARIEGNAERVGEYVLGVDLGQTAAMSAVAAYWPESGRLECFAVFPQKPSLAERGQHDGVGNLYERMAARSELLIAGEYVSDVQTLLAAALDRWGKPSVITADRWRQCDLMEALSTIGFPFTGLSFRGQGFRDGGEDVRLFRRACVSGKCRPVVSLLLRAAMSEARVVSDPAGNSKLSKGSQGGRRQRARDDAAAAAILSVGEGERRAAMASQDKPRYLGMVNP